MRNDTKLDILWNDVKELKASSGGSDLPDVTAADNGKVLGVVEGVWNKMDAPAGGVDYSTTEQDTGRKWIDAKPIYSKTVQGTLGNGGDSSTLVSGVATLINVEGVFGDSYMRPVYIGSYNSDTAPTVRLNSGSIIVINNSPNLGGRDYSLTLYYTKTTETKATKKKTTKNKED